MSKRLFYYLVINIIVSAVTVWAVLSIWERAHTPDETATPQPISRLPTALASAQPLMDTPAPQISPTPLVNKATPTQNQSSADGIPQATVAWPLPPESPQIKITTIVGIGDLATERLQIQSVSPDAISLENWRLETSTGEVYTFPKITLFEYGAVDLYSRTGINSVVALYWGHSAPVFHRGDRVVIYDTEGEVQAVYSIP